VVTATNLLSDRGLELATGEQISVAELRTLLHIAGESGRKLDLGAAIRSAILTFLYYAATPAFAVLISLR
jgi:hypothetical protein